MLPSANMLPSGKSLDDAEDVIDDDLDEFVDEIDIGSQLVFSPFWSLNSIFSVTGSIS